MSKIIIAIDGHSSCGKSTMAKALAQQVGYIYVDSGAMYRAVTLFALREQLFNADGSVQAETLQARMSDVKVHFKLDPDTHLPVTYLNEERVEDEIRTLEVSQHVSPIAALPFVREAMTAAQQAMGEEKGIVMDGRDIGTAVFPHAELKIFVTASAEVRAQRRFDELQAKGLPASYEDILKTSKSATTSTRTEKSVPCAKPKMPLCSTTPTSLVRNKTSGCCNNLILPCAMPNKLLVFSQGH